MEKTLLIAFAQRITMQTSRKRLCLAVLTICSLFAVRVGVAAAADELEPLLKTLQAVGPKAAGNRDAGAAWERLVRADAAQLPAVLAALDDAGPLAANWIRTAVDTIAERQLRDGGKLPADALQRFVLDRRHDPRARRLAYEWLCRVDASAPQRLIPGMLDDPSLEMRRDAVARLIAMAETLAKTGEDTGVVSLYAQALAAARDVDQIRLLAGRLKKLGRPIDLPRQFGFLVRWNIIGPFDNTGEKGFDVAYPPEQEIDLRASYSGKHGEVRWVEHTTDDEYGAVDLNRVLGEEKGVIGYATTEFISPARKEVELRATSFSALKLWLNGRLIDQHKVYHGGSQMDQYTCPAELNPGRNVILLKVCQNEQTQSWANVWRFQLRVCTADGAAVLSADREPTSPPPEPAP